MEVKSLGRYIRVSPQKARLVADMIRGMMVGEALNVLSVSKKKSAKIIEKILKSAISNAANNHNVKDTDSLSVKTIMVDGGPVLKRHRSRSRGSVDTIRKRTSHINVIIG